jgi:hypothetical protein
VNRFNLEAVVPGLHRRVVVAVAFLAHAAQQLVVPQQAPMVGGAILAAPVGMDDDAGRPLL